METESITATDELAPAKGSRRSENGATSASITLGPRDSLVGKLTFDGDVRVLGKLDGELSATGDVSVEAQGTVKAAVEARNVSVRGQLEGDVVAREKLLIVGSGTVEGNVRVARLAIEDGATLNGNVQMVAKGAAKAAATGGGA